MARCAMIAPIIVTSSAPAPIAQARHPEQDRGPNLDHASEVAKPLADPDHVKSTHHHRDPVKLGPTCGEEGEA
jgi:hypothetical protein